MNLDEVRHAGTICWPFLPPPSLPPGGGAALMSCCFQLLREINRTSFSRALRTRRQASQSEPRAYVGAQFKTLPLEFTLGDGRNHGDFHNRPLLNGQEYVFFVLALLDLSETVSGGSAGAGEQVVAMAMNATPPPPPSRPRSPPARIRSPSPPRTWSPSPWWTRRRGCCGWWGPCWPWSSSSASSSPSSSSRGEPSGPGVLDREYPDGVDSEPPPREAGVVPGSAHSL